MVTPTTVKGIDLLDHGYVRFVEDWGRGDAGLPEAGIIEAARQSTSGSFRGWETDDKLLRHLYTHRHSTPFEMAGLIIEVQAPLFVFREWHRHRTQSYNELSARYTELPDLNYVPSYERLSAAAQSAVNKQGSEGQMSSVHVEEAAHRLHAHNQSGRDLYEWMLKVGYAREIARLPVNVAQYSRMRACANLWNWFKFLDLRLPENVQWETRMYANAVEEVVKAHFPRSFALFHEQFRERNVTVTEGNCHENPDEPTPENVVSRDLFIHGRGVSALVNITKGGDVTYSVSQDGKNVAKGTLVCP